MVIGLCFTRSPLNQTAEDGQEILNLLTHNVNYSGRTAPLTSKVVFYIFIQQIYVLNILNMLYTLRLTAVGTRCADHVTPLYPQKLALTSPTDGGRSVGIFRVRTKATEFSFSLYILRFFSLQNAVCFVILTYLVPVLFTFYTIQVLLKFKKK